MEISGNYAYLAKTNLQIVDISNPTNPHPVGSFPLESGPMRARGNYLYIAHGGLQVVDVSNPAQPRLVDNYNVDHSVSTVRVRGKYAYLLERTGDFRVLDVSRFEAPLEIGHCSATPLRSAFDLAGNLAYLAGRQTLDTIDVSDPTHPTLIASSAIGEEANHIELAGHFAYMAGDNPYGIRILDVSNPASPLTLARIPSWARTAHVVGQYLYLASMGLRIFNVTNPASPTLVATIGEGGYDVAVSDGLAFMVADPEGESPIQIFDVHTPAQPVLLSERGYPAYPDRALVNGRHLYTIFSDDNGTAGWAIHDLNAPAQSSLVHVRPNRNTTSLDVADGVIFVAQGRYGLGIIPTIPDVQFGIEAETERDTSFTLQSAT